MQKGHVIFFYWKHCRIKTTKLIFLTRTIFSRCIVKLFTFSPKSFSNYVVYLLLLWSFFRQWMTNIKYFLKRSIFFVSVPWQNCRQRHSFFTFFVWDNTDRSFSGHYKQITFALTSNLKPVLSNDAVFRFIFEVW